MMNINTKTIKDTEKIAKLLKRLDEREQLVVFSILQGVKMLTTKNGSLITAVLSDQICFDT